LELVGASFLISVESPLANISAWSGFMNWRGVDSPFTNSKAEPFFILSANIWNLKPPRLAKSKNVKALKSASFKIRNLRGDFFFSTPPLKS
jgi:hypothetical protein